MFIYFLDRNNALFIDGDKIIEDYTLVALTIMIAKSKPEEKEIMIKVIMNCLNRSWGLYSMTNAISLYTCMIL